MAQLIADKRDIDFVVLEQLGLIDHEKYADFNKKTVDIIIKEARNLALKELLPTQQTGDREGCRLENGQVKVPEAFHALYKTFHEGEWMAMCDTPEVGGQGMPKAVGMAAKDYFMGANVAFMLYQGMTHGAARLVQQLGSEEQKRVYLKNMFSGKWAGTMLLTESEAGSDVGALTTKAVKNADGTYSITGTKIFISGGDQNLTENIIHPVLARIEGAPEGTAGISMFLVPKYRVNDDGSIGEFNNVECIAVEEKMGLHGNATCALALGGKGDCIGTLLGEENKGLQGMFLMMNESRHFVGCQGLAVATASYMYALDYSRNRIQSRHILAGKDYSAPKVAIIEHPDVRRQLLTMKAYVEGMRSLLYFYDHCFDLIDIEEDDAQKQRLSYLIEVLTPIAKGYCTDKGLEVTSTGIQVYGGYGYISEYPMEQLFRDSRIFMIYEGTNGIHAIDFLGRKMSMKKGAAFQVFLEEIEKCIDQAAKIEGLEALSDKMKAAFEKFKATTTFMAGASRSENLLNAYAAATPLLDAAGDITMAWMLLWRASVAAPKLAKLAGSMAPEARKAKAEKHKDAAYYEGQIKTAEFFINTKIPVMLGQLDAVMGLDGAAVEIPDLSFGAK